MPDTKPDDAANFGFEILFEGLVALVPWKGPDVGETGQFLLALPQLLRGGPSDDRLPRPIPPHVACVVVPSKNIANPQSSGADLEFGPPGGPYKQIFEFKGEKMTLVHGGPQVFSAPKAVLTPSQVSPKDTGAPEETNLAWVPSLRRTEVEGADAFDARLVAKNLAPGTNAGFNRLAGTFVPVSGTLAINRVVSFKGEPVIFDFRDQAGEGESRFRQAMFDRLVLHDSAPSSLLQMFFTQEDGTQRSVDLVLHPNRNLELKVLNLELEEIVGLGSTVQRSATTLDKDLDFAVGYWLSRAWETVSKADIVVPHAKGHGPGGSGPPCRVSSYEGIK